MLNLKNTLDGYLKNVEVIGNTTQDANNLADIRSVGDKVEGQELYKIDVVSCGKNLLKNITSIHSSSDLQGLTVSIIDSSKLKIVGTTNSTAWIVLNIDKISFKSGVTYFANSTSSDTLFFEAKIGDKFVMLSNSFTFDENVECNVIRFRISQNKTLNAEVGITVHSGTQATPYEPYKGDKLEILSPVQLEKVGDVTDRIICRDGVWGVEKNVDAEVRNNVLVNTRTNSEFISLPHDQQIKLRTFAGQTNIAFLTEIPGQIKAQVPKSLGATVNTHTEQIADLHNSLERVKKLEETTVSTVETESSFTTVDATSNGYFEDVKLEGKTLVNKLPKIGNNSYESGDNIIPRFVANFMPNSNHCIDVRGFSQSITIVCLDGGITTEWLSYNNNEIKWRGILYTDKSIQHIQLPNECASLSFKLPKSNGFSLDNVSQTKILLLEGDHTNNPPEYFEGLMSVGQDVEEVSVASCDFVDITEFELGGFNGEGYPVENGARVRTSNYIPYANTKLKLGMLGSQEAEIVFYNKDKTKLSNIAWVKDGDIVAVPNNTQYVRVALRYPNDVVIYPSDIKYFKMSCPKDKKPLLYFNPITETWEKPVLREWDTIEKHSDGKYYYHKRSGEVIVDGSKKPGTWVNNPADIVNIYYYSHSLNTSPGKGYGKLINNKLPNNVGGHMGTQEGVNYTDYFTISVHKDKLGVTSVNDATEVNNKFTAWLKDNPITIVYQLAQEEVYECTNIDLMTYSGETNYIINSGAISPKSLLKVHNNISNVVKILQEKVSLLENTFIAGLKSVLSGDMYSLATILYPEDFEQNDSTEQDIMVIPE